MPFEVLTTDVFEKRAKRLIKKYPSLETELDNLIDQLAEKPELGTALFDNCFKIRLAIKSKGKGKSGGARVITHFIVRKSTVLLLSIYDKSELETISKEEIKEILDGLS